MTRLPGSRLVVATHNSGKLREITELLGAYGVSIVPIADFGLPEPEETGTTFRENARIKAEAALAASGLPALADDSGLCVDALGGAPGVYSADWAEGPDGRRDWMRAMERVERELQLAGATTPEARRAQFVATLCLAYPDGHVEFFEGEVAGTIVWPPRGDQGFGYDPVFLPDGETRTFGEMSPQEKNGRGGGPDGLGLSHRTRAFAQLAGALFET